MPRRRETKEATRHARTAHSRPLGPHIRTEAEANPGCGPRLLAPPPSPSALRRLRRRSRTRLPPAPHPSRTCRTSPPSPPSLRRCPSNGDVNPYGVATVPFSTGSLVRGDTLVSNFNASNQHTGNRHHHRRGGPDRTGQPLRPDQPQPAGCPGGVGLTTALSVLERRLRRRRQPAGDQRREPARLRPGASSSSTATACRSRRGPATASTGRGT